MEKRFNADYEIIGAVKISDGREGEAPFEFVIGHNPNNTCTPYVTWECANGNIYYWGHYFRTKREAIYDFMERIKRKEKYFNKE